MMRFSSGWMAPRLPSACVSHVGLASVAREARRKAAASSCGVILAWPAFFVCSVQ